TFAALATDRLAAGDTGAGASPPLLGSLATELALNQELDPGPSRFELKHGLSEFGERIDPLIGASAGGLPSRVADGPDRCPAGSVGVRAQRGEGVPCPLKSFFPHVDHALDDGHQAAPDLLGV